MSFVMTKKQFAVLEGLAYRIADNAYMRERYGDDEPELENVRKTIHSLFDELDRLQVPFWVQNTVIVWAEDWRRYKTDDMASYLTTRGIF